MVIDFYNRNGGGGSADYATSAGTSNSTKLLEGGSALPQSANTGDVVAVAPNLSKRGGAKGGETALGIYQYDGSAWNEIGGETPDFTGSHLLVEKHLISRVIPFTCIISTFFQFVNKNLKKIQHLA